MNKKHDEVSATKALHKTGEVKVNSVDKTVTVQKNSTHVGNGSWGRINYLCNYCGYVQLWADKVSATQQNKKEDDNDTPSTGGLKQKKLNMAEMTKNAMKKAKR